MSKVVNVVEIEWLSEEAKEAFVMLSDGIFQCEVFCMPCRLSVGQQLGYLLRIFEPTLVQHAATRTPSLFRLKNGEHDLVGVLTNRIKGIIQVGAFTFIIEPIFIPGDVVDGDFLRVCCERIDCDLM